MDLNNPAEAMHYWWKHEKHGNLMQLLKMLGVSKAVYDSWRKQLYIPQKYVALLAEFGFQVEPYMNQPFNFAKQPEDGVTLAEIGDEFEVSRERARQISVTAMRNFAKELQKRGIKKEDFF